MPPRIEPLALAALLIFNFRCSDYLIYPALALGVYIVSQKAKSRFTAVLGSQSLFQGSKYMSKPASVTDRDDSARIIHQPPRR